MVQGYGAAPGGGYGQPGFGGGQAQGQMGANYQVMTIDVGCGGTLEHTRIAELANQMGAQGFVLQQVFIDIRSSMGPFCPKRCAVLVFRRA